MSDFGRIHAFVVTNRNGSVLYERFYDQLSEIQKAEMRTALGQCSRDVARMANGQVGVGNFRYAHEWTRHAGHLGRLALRPLSVPCTVQGRHYRLPAVGNAGIFLCGIW
jgi:hypothetical protein